MLTRVPRDGLSATPRNRLRLIVESIRINLRLGIFWHRPFLQCMLLLGNLLKHPFRRWRAGGE